MHQTRIILSTVIAVALFIGGIVILLSHVPFWSYFFGLPAAQIGIVMLILTYEKLSKKTLEEEIEEEMIREKKHKKDSTEEDD